MACTPQLVVVSTHPHTCHGRFLDVCWSLARGDCPAILSAGVGRVCAVSFCAGIYLTIARPFRKRTALLSAGGGCGLS
jgi:hypothetical protein